VDLQLELARYSGESEALERSYSFLPKDKQDQVRALAQHYDDLEQAIYIRTRGWLLDGDQEELRQIQRQRREQMASLLNTEEMEEYNLRFSETANSLRTLMTGFQPNEEEFRRIFRLQHTFDTQFEQAFDGADESAVSGLVQARDKAEEALMTEMRNLLGPQRYAEYERSQNSDYRTLLQLSERVEMPVETANRIFAMKQAAEQAKMQVENNPRLSEEDRARNVAELARLTARAVQNSMGEDTYKIYQENGGQWVGDLSVVDESAVPRQQPAGTTLPYDIRQFPPDLQQYLLNPALFIRPEFRPGFVPNNP
jgi:hypothetical protein